MKATAASTGGALTVLESVVGQGPPRHVHDHEDECFGEIDQAASVAEQERIGDDYGIRVV